MLLEQNEDIVQLTTDTKVVTILYMACYPPIPTSFSVKVIYDALTLFGTTLTKSYTLNPIVAFSTLYLLKVLVQFTVNVLFL